MFRIMEEREKLLRRVALKCVDFARQLSYHRALRAYSGEFRQNFWICTYNNFIDLAVLDWFHLFGYHNDDLHWKRVVSDVDDFRNSLFGNVRMTEDEWKAYRNEVKDYRDKDVAHIEVRPVSHVPDMTTALHATSYYYKYVVEELSGLSTSTYSNWPRDLNKYHQKSLSQAEELVKVAYESVEHFEEKVR